MPLVEIFLLTFVLRLLYADSVSTMYLRHYRLFTAVYKYSFTQTSCYHMRVN